MNNRSNNSSSKSNNNYNTSNNVSEFDPVRRSIIVRIDNLPPGKSWKEVRYLIGGIIHHSNIIQVKMLPLMSSIVPPFVPFQSCIVTLKSKLDPESLNELLVSLNTYQWDYYNLYAYTLPPLDAMQQFIPMVDQPTQAMPPNDSNYAFNDDNNNNNTFPKDEVSTSPTSSNSRTEPQTPKDTRSSSSALYPTPIPAPDPAAPTGTTPVTAAAAAAAVAAATTGTPGPFPPPPGTMMAPAPLAPGPGPGIGPTPPFGALNGGIPAMAPHPSLMGMGPGLPRRHYYQPHFYGLRKFGSHSGGSISRSTSTSGKNSQRGSRSSNGGNASGGNNADSNDGSGDLNNTSSDGYMLSAAASAAAAAAASTANQGFGVNLHDNSRGNIANNNSRRLKQIFNERTFRKQMTGRGMSQLQISGFPPFIKLDSWEPIQLEYYRSLGEKGVQSIETDQPEKYGRLRWTILKDYIKLKCPKLLSLQDDSSPTENTSNSRENNTREFYVGVYEDHEESLGIKVVNGEDKPEYGLSSATVYKAIVGFNNGELCDACTEALRDQEYSLGYKLEIKELPPYDEEKQQQRTL